MKLFACAATVAALGLSAAALAQKEPTADELLAKHVEALGGQAAIDAIKSVQFEGEMRFPGDFKLNFKDVRDAASGAGRAEATLQGLTLVQAYDGKSGWRIN